jgi:GAF domain-containing protein
MVGSSSLQFLLRSRSPHPWVAVNLGGLYDVGMNTADALAGLEAALARGGIRAALAFLNAMTEYRFTALYRYDDPILRHLYFYDREHPDFEETDDFPVEVTYCVFVRRTGQPFVLEDALHDVRVDGHPAQERVLSYCGVALVDDVGRIFGTMCHFDCVPVTAQDKQAELMEELAPLVVARFCLASRVK